VFISSLEETNDGILYALPLNDPNNDGIIALSEVIWKFATHDFDSGSSPAVSTTSGKVIIGSNDGFAGGTGKLFCVDENSGDEIWNFTTNGDIHGSPLIAQEKIFIGSLDNYMYCIGGNITVENRPPIANAGPDKFVTVNQTVNFDGSGSYDPDNDTLTYKWDFGDGTSSEEKNSSNITHIFQQPGNYTVTLNVSDRMLSDTDTCIIIVNKKVINNVENTPPHADAGTHKTVNIGETVIFDGSRSYDPDGDKLTYIWGFDDGTTTGWQESPKATHSYNKPGEYRAKLIVSDGKSRVIRFSLISVLATQPKGEVNDLIKTLHTEKTNSIRLDISSISGSPIKLQDAQFQMLTKAQTSVYRKTIKNINPIIVHTSVKSSIYAIPSGPDPVFENAITGDGMPIDSESVGNLQEWEGCYFAYIDATSDNLINTDDSIWLYKDWNNDDIDDFYNGYSFLILNNNGKTYSRRELGNTFYQESLLNKDIDLDGLPDYWENKYSLDPDDPSDADIDSDKDSLTNLIEYVLGTDPLKPDTDLDSYSDGLDAFPTDPAASKDSDGDNYPDQWNTGKSWEESTTGLKLDAYPNNPNKFESEISKDEPPHDNTSAIFMIVIVIIILLIVATLKLFLLRSKRQWEKIPDSDEEMINILKDKIFQGESLSELEYSRNEIDDMLERTFKSGQISENTYNIIRSEILYSDANEFAQLNNSFAKGKE
jgi:PKD repeat protein